MERPTMHHVRFTLMRTKHMGYIRVLHLENQFGDKTYYWSKSEANSTEWQEITGERYESFFTSELYESMGVHKGEISLPLLINQR